MSDSAQMQMAKALSDVAQYMKELVKIHKTLNENMVAVVQEARKFLTVVNNSVESVELTMREPDTIYADNMPLPFPDRKETDAPE